VLALQKNQSTNATKLNKRSIKQVLYSSLWAVHSPTEAFISKHSVKRIDHFFYESADGNIGTIYHIPCLGRPQKKPIVILTGILFHPQVCLSKETPAIHELREHGHDIYCITHRGHFSSDSSACLDHSFDAIIREDFPAALKAIRNKTNLRNFHWIGQGSGGILGLLWVAHTGWAGIEKLILINTPVRFPQHYCSLIRSTFKGIPSQFSFHPLLHLHMAIQKGLGLTIQERSWIYSSHSSIHPQILEQILQWFTKGYLCNLEGDINYLRAIPTGRNKVFVTSTGSHFFGQQECCYPLIPITQSNWIDHSGTPLHFPLFSSSLSRLLANCN